MPVPDMTYNVFSGTLNPTQSICLAFDAVNGNSIMVAHSWHCGRWLLF